MGINFKSALGDCKISFRFDTLEEYNERLKEAENTKNEEVISALKYNLIYDHCNPLPKLDGHNEYFEEDFYNENHLIEKPKTAKVKDYKDNIQGSSEIFKIKYSVLEKRSELKGTKYSVSYWKVVECQYNAKTLKEAKNALLSHSKSKRFFNLKLYQCENLLA